MGEAAQEGRGCHNEEALIAGQQVPGLLDPCSLQDSTLVKP